MKDKARLIGMILQLMHLLKFVLLRLWLEIHQIVTLASWEKIYMMKAFNNLIGRNYQYRKLKNKWSSLKKDW